MKDSTRTLLMLAGVAGVIYALMRSGSATAGTVPLQSSAQAPAASAAPASGQSAPLSAFDRVLDTLAGAWASVTQPAQVAAPLSEAPTTVAPGPLPVAVTVVQDPPRVQAAVQETAPDEPVYRPAHKESWYED